MTYQKKHPHIFWFVIALMTVLVGCSPPAVQSGEGDKVKVVATTTFLGDTVKRVAGDAVDLVVILKPGQNPHAYQAAPRDLVQVSDADLVFANGFGLEEFLDDLLTGAENQDALVIASRNISPLLVNSNTRSHAEGEEHPEEAHEGEHHHQEGEDHGDDHHQDEDNPEEGESQDQEHNHLGQDPHVWFDPNNVILWVEVISEQLAAQDPGQADLYRQNAAVYREELEELDRWIREQTAAIPEENRELVTGHTVFGYFAEEYGFEQIGAVIPAPTTEAETSGQQLAALLETIQENNVGAIFVSRDIDPTLAERVAEDTGAELVPLYFGSLTEGDPAETYLDFMRYNVEAIAAALK